MRSWSSKYRKKGVLGFDSKQRKRKIREEKERKQTGDRSLRRRRLRDKGRR